MTYNPPFSPSCADIKSILVSTDAITKQIDNGLKVILKEVRTSPHVTAQVYVKAGSAFEGNYQGTGISHFVEHMVWWGTAKRNYREIFQTLRKIGNSYKAYTSRDFTCYSITTARDHLETALDILADILQNAIFPQEVIDTQKRTILNEMDSVKNNPNLLMLEFFKSLVFEGEAAQHPVIGLRHLFLSLRKNDLAEYYSMAYKPGNMIVVVVGGCKAERVIEAVQKLLGNSKEKKSCSLYEPQESGAMKNIRKELVLSNLDSLYLKLGFRTTSFGNKDIYAVEVISSLLKRGLHLNLSRRPKLRSIYSYPIEVVSFTPRYYLGYLSITTKVNAHHGIILESAIMDELINLKNRDLSVSKIEDARKDLIKDYICRNRTIEAKAEGLAWNELLANDVGFDAKYFEEIKNISPYEVKRIARKYLNDDRLIAVTLKPKGIFSFSR